MVLIHELVCILNWYQSQFIIDTWTGITAFNSIGASFWILVGALKYYIGTSIPSILNIGSYLKFYRNWYTRYCYLLLKYYDPSIAAIGSCILNWYLNIMIKVNVLRIHIFILNWFWTLIWFKNNCDLIQV